MVGAEHERHVGPRGQRGTHRGLHALGLVLEEPDRLDRDDDRPAAAVADRDRPRVDRIVDPLEEVVDAARRVEAVVAAVRVGIAVDVGVVVEEAGAVLVDVRLLQAEQARPGEHRRGTRREHGRVGGRVERGRRDVDLGGPDEKGSLRADVARREDEEGNQQQPDHWAAITSAWVKGMGLYSKRS